MTENELQVQKKIVLAFNGDISEEPSFEHFIYKLEEYINYLIKSNFQRLLNLLYKIDISENFLRKLLKDENKDSAVIIAKLIIQRQAEKVKTWPQFNVPDSAEEKW